MQAHSLWFSSLTKSEWGWGEGELVKGKAALPFCLETFLTVIAACLFWFSEISKPINIKTHDFIKRNRPLLNV